MDGKKIFGLGTIAGLLMVAMASVAVTPVKAASNTFDDEINSYILGEAGKWTGKYFYDSTGKGNCKEWVRKVVKDASGKLLYDVPTRQVWYWPKRDLPATQPSGDRWYETSWTIVVCRGTNSLCAYSGMIKPGQIIQLKHRYNGGTPHTMIVERATSSGFQVIDSNWNKDAKCQSHWIDRNWFDTQVISWTVYQLR